jgi:phenylalanine-4-hydroxylase
MESNPIIDKLPKHLKQYIVDQHYENYTPIDHAVWRYVMRQNVNYLKKVAHPAYMDGLEQTGITIDRIPNVTGANRILAKIGWAAVNVDGFIPPAAFMEFQAYKVLVIAADIRQLKHIEYTPAPDIIHEAAGHAPFIAVPEYSEYLVQFGDIGSKAFSSAKDYELYEAIRHLSIIKEYPYTPKNEIEEGEKRIAEIQSNMGMPSEMALIRRLHWWTVEYGLIGTLHKPMIYGAGLLSSIGESTSCLKDDVKKLPYNIEAANYEFDITKPQPHLFVTPSFDHLKKVLIEFADTMALCKGGLEGIKKAIGSKNIATVVYSSGLQISGLFTEVLTDSFGSPLYIKTAGPTNLAIRNKELPGHSKEYHNHGFGSPIGRLQNTSSPLEFYSESDLMEADIQQGKETKINFQSGVIVIGRVEKIIRSSDGRVCLISFSNCEVTYQDKKLFDPIWGFFDMAVGEKIISVFSGAADKEAFDQHYLVPSEHTKKIEYDEKTKKLQNLYKEVRNIRNTQKEFEKLPSVLSTLQTEYPFDWLLPIEILEIVEKNQSEKILNAEIFEYMHQLKSKHSAFNKLISDGIKLLCN